MKFIKYVYVLMAILLLFNCTQNNMPYQQIIAERSCQDTVLSYKNIKIGDAVSKLNIPDTINTIFYLPNLEEQDVNFEPTNINGSMYIPHGNIKVSIEQNNAKQIQSLTIDIDGDIIDNKGGLLQSLVQTYMNKFGIFSYYEERTGAIGSSSHFSTKDIPTNIESIKTILYKAQTQQERIIQSKQESLKKPQELQFVWEWKNQAIAIKSSSYSSSTIYIIYHVKDKDINRNIKNNTENRSNTSKTFEL